VKALLPREHGAYAQLGFPLMTGLWYAGGHPGAIAFAAVAVSAFLAHEPLSLIMGMRGIRLRDALVGPARRRLWVLAGLAVVALGAAAVLAPARSWAAALVPATFGLVLIPLFFLDRVKTIGGEVVAVAAFSSVLVPVALAGTAGAAEAWTAAAVWFWAGVPAVVSVHAVKAAHKGRPRARWLVPGAPALAVVAGLTGVAAALALPYPALRAVAVLPPAAAVVGVGILRPHPRHLKRIGWTVVSANVIAAVLLIVL
jgi:hypothetical protein